MPDPTPPDSSASMARRVEAPTGQEPARAAAVPDSSASMARRVEAPTKAKTHLYPWPSPPARPFTGLQEMKTEHAALQRRRRGNFADEETVSQEIANFLYRGHATGAFLGSEDERYAAQGLLTYWSNILYRRGGEVEDDSLAPFEPGRAPELKDTDNPYLNLDRPPEDLSRSPGWQRLIDEAVRAVRDNRVTAVVGAAGGGRTVLVRCGLLPALRSGRLLPGSDRWDYLPPLTPGKDPLADLVRVLTASGAAPPAPDSGRRLARDPAGEVRRLAAALPRPAVLVVERFDEMLTRDDPAVVRAFADALLALVGPDAPGHRVILVSDPGVLVQVKALGEFGPRLLQGQVLVTFSAAELREMVLEPARRVGLRFDDGLVDRLLLDVQGDPAALALLQFTLRRLWDARQGNRITHDAYDRVGGGRLAVARCAEEVFVGLKDDEQKAAKAVLLRLIRPAPGVGISCLRLPRDQLLPADLPPDLSRRVLQGLVDAGLVVRTDVAGDGPGEYAPVHESLATAWPRFLEWLEEVRGKQQWRLRLRAAAEQWQSQGRKQGALWGGAVLELALEEVRRLKKVGESLDELEQQFLDASQALDRRWRLARWGIIAAAVVVCLAGVATYVRYQATSLRYQARLTAAEAQLRKQADLLNASWQLKEGAELAGRGRFPDTSGAFLWYAGAWTDFAASSDAVQDKAERERLEASYLVRLGVARRQLPALAGMAYHKEFAGAAATPDGKVLLTVGADEDGRTDRPTAYVWHWSGTPLRGEWVASTLPWVGPPKDTSAVTSASLSPDGRLAVVTAKSGEKAGKAYVWSVSPDGWRFAKELKHKGRLEDAALSPDGRYFAVISTVEGPSPEGRVTLWEAKRWERVGLDFPKTVGPLKTLAFSPRSDRLAVTVGSPPASPGPTGLTHLILQGLGGLALAPAGVPAGALTQSLSPLGVLRTHAFARPRVDPVICLEWSLETFPPPGRAKHYTGAPASPSAPPGDETTFAVYGPAGADLLLFVSRGREDHWPDAWLFDAKADPPQGGARVWTSSNEPVLQAAFSPRGDRLATAGADGRVTLFTVRPNPGRPATASWLRTLSHEARVFYADFSPDGQYVVTASRDRRAQVWDVDSGQPTHPCLHHSGTVDVARFTPDGRQVITLSQGAAYRWDLAGGERRPLLLSVPRPVRALAADPEGRSVLAAGDRPARTGGGAAGGWAQVWDARTGAPRTPLLPHPTGVRHAAISPAGTGLVSTVGVDGTVRLWDVSAPDYPVWSAPPKPWRAVYTAFGRHRGRLFLLAVTRQKPDEPSGRGGVRVWSVGAHGGATEVGAFEYDAPYDTPFTAAAFSPDCERVVAFTGEGPRGVAVVWEVGKDNKPASLRREGAETAHSEPITCAAFSEDGKQLVTTSKDDTAVVWSMPGWRGKKLQGGKDDVVEGHTADVLFAAFDRSGRRVVTAGADRQAIVWQRADERAEFRPVVALNLGAAPVQASFSTDEEQRYVLTASYATTPSQPFAVPGPEAALRYALAAGYATTQLWDAKDGRVVATRHYPGQVRQFHCRTDGSGNLRVVVLGSQAPDGVPPRPAPGSGPGPREGSGWVMVGEWDLSPAVDPAPDRLRLLAEMTASQRLVAHPDFIQVTRLPPEAVYRRWQERARGGDSGPPGARVGEAEWHEREAGWAESLGRWPAAQWHLRRALDLLPRSRSRVPLLVRRARVRIRSGEFIDPADEPAARQEWERAEQDLSGALKGRAWDPDLLRARAEARARLGRYAEAIADYERVLQADPEDSLTRVQLADAYDRAGDPERAAAEYARAGRGGPSDPDLLLRRATVLARNGRFDRAFEGFLDAARGFRSRRQWNDAEKAYGKALALCNKHVQPTAPTEARVHGELGEVLTTQGDYRRARTHFTRAARLDPSVWTHWSGLARSHERLGEWKKAVEAFDEAIKLNPRDVSLARERADALVRLKDWDGAAGAYRAVIALEPKLLSHRLRLAAIYLQPVPPDKPVSPERLGEASRCLAEAAKAFPTQSTAWLYLAAVQLAAGDGKGYRATRAGMLKRFRDASAPAASDAAWASSLAPPDTPEGLARALGLARKAVSAFPHSPTYLHTLGATLYRAGRRGEAASRLREATGQRARAFLPPDREAYENACDLLFLAMAEYIPSKAEQARATLRSAARAIERLDAGRATESPDLSLSRVWYRLQLQTLRREAERLVDKP